MIFKTYEEFQRFCDTGMFCICGRLMTGLHMDGCLKLRAMKMKLKKREDKILQKKP